ncbi:peptidoglycan editing factor PgeF [Clostridium oryzae]|uniref:Purine nucleoside phosphorylase n=1 Tax=Clostridium oryzae TaxID=1450648 RepID=A0A1V4IHV0_9CLOT|nr:peptidoglycan editing factor PgeF [Clostridium oryzae]OPJ59097.1 laccase domain protein YfiH [Clostridium oryzae]
MEIIDKGNYKFIKHTIGRADFVFSTGENNINFDFRNKENEQVLEDIKHIFRLKGVGYLRQVHGIDIHKYGDEAKEGDGIITNKYDTAVGVFTADCVPVLLYDIENQVCAAVHSGWRGTLSKITIEALDKMKDDYGTSMKNVYAVIGPHIGVCCYEVGEEVKNLFQKDSLYKNVNIFNDNRLDMQLCIETQLSSRGVDKDRIITADFCTCCSDIPKFHSYRRDKGSNGRMFSFVYLSEK